MKKDMGACRTFHGLKSSLVSLRVFSVKGSQWELSQFLLGF